MNQRRFVLIAADSRYAHPSMPGLDGVRDDAERLRATLEQHGDGGVHRVHWLADGNATRANILDSLQAIAGEAGVTDQVVIYFGGHGLRERDDTDARWRYYLLPYDASADSAPATGIGPEVLATALNARPSGHPRHPGTSSVAGPRPSP